MATAGVGLSDEQVGQLREDLAAGKFPRVRITAKHFGAASAGTVRKVGDPARDGEDYLTVRVTVNGVTDDLRFAPRELSRGRAPVAKASVAPVAKSRSATPAPAVKAAKATAPSPRTPAPRTEPARTASPTRAAKPSRRNAPGAPVKIILTSSGASWTVSAHRGARSVVKSAAVNPGAVSSIAALLGVPALEDAVAAVNDTARVEAEARAERLRSELAEIQVVLDSHRRP